jgi:hypothetical protein
VSYVHTYGFVHKGIRSDIILIFKDQESTLGSLFLVGFKTFRMADGRTLRRGDSAWERNIYRHPQRQGLHPDEDYTMQHDIYSLGVCLLEIGLWESFVTYNTHGDPSPSPALGIHPESPNLKKPFSIKEGLTALAKDVLPKKMGNRYAQIVVTCLTCLDEDNAEFGDKSEFEDGDGVLVAVRYIEKVQIDPSVKNTKTNASDMEQILLPLDAISV